MNFDFGDSPKAGIFGLSLDTSDLPDISSSRESVGTSFNSAVPTVPDLSTFNDSADNLRGSVMGDHSNFFGSNTPAPPTAAELNEDSGPEDNNLPVPPQPPAHPAPPPPPPQQQKSLPVAPPTPDYSRPPQDFPQTPNNDDASKTNKKVEEEDQQELPLPVKKTLKFHDDVKKDKSKNNSVEDDEEDNDDEHEQYSLLTTKSNYQVLGLNSQIVNIELQPKESVRCEPGVLMHMDPKIENHTTCHGSVSRCMSGEKQFRTTFTNRSSQPLVLGLSPNQPSSKIVPVELDDPLIENKLKCLKGAWLGTMGTSAELSFQFDCRPITCCFGGQGIRQQVIHGSGVVFLVGGGTIMRRVMERHEKVVLDDHCLLAWSGTVGFAGRTAAERCTEWCCNCTGEGLFNFVISGGDKGGVIYIQSMPFPKYKAAVTGGDPKKH